MLILAENTCFIPPGGWQGRGSFKVTFNSGGAIEFAQHFKHAVASGMCSPAQLSTVVRRTSFSCPWISTFLFQFKFPLFGTSNK